MQQDTRKRESCKREQFRHRRTSVIPRRKSVNYTMLQKYDDSQVVELRMNAEESPISRGVGRSLDSINLIRLIEESLRIHRIRF